jgi:BirA family transcriptional regulator, biotin operon repressor / biotin---[acetyl-CoA-carboxylase] ligase
MKALNESLIKLVSCLNDLQYHNGEVLGKQLGVSRMMIWKMINKLIDIGIKIESVKNKGYRFQDNLLLLDGDFIKKQIDNPDIKLNIVGEIASTNDFVRENINIAKKVICVSEAQSKGRGRMARFWHSPFAQNIYFSYGYRINKDLDKLSGLSLVVGIAMINAIREVIAIENLKLKWPNDLLHNGKKIMGNLVEIKAEAYGEISVVIGVGVNVNMLDDDNQISQQWSSLRKISGGVYIDRNLLVVSMIHNLNFYIDQFHKYGLSKFIEQWQKYDALYGKSVSLDDGKISGIAKGISNNGSLLVELNSGELKEVASGEVYS